MKHLCSRVGMIPVTRVGRDTTSLKAALRTLAAGHVLGLFPEGRIAQDHQLLPFQPGLAVIAARSKSEIFPVAIEGLRRNQSLLEVLLVPQEAKIFYGSPLTPTSEPRKIWTAVQMLQQQALATRSIVD